MKHQPKILIVDDRSENLVAMQHIMKHLSAGLLCSQSGEHALALTLEHHFSLILLDVMMPGMNGFEVAELLRLNELTKRIPIIFVTALGRDDAHEFQGYEAGAVDYLLKPINPDILLSKVKIFLDLDRYQRELQVSEERYRCLIEKAPDIIYTFSNKRGGLYYSSRVESILGYPASYLCQHPFLWNESIHPDDVPLIRQAIEELPLETDFDIEYRIRNAKGEWRWLHDRSISKRIEGDEIIIEGLASDITDRKQSQETLEYLAQYDQLTGLANRRMFHDFQEKALSRARRYQRGMAILFLDLDHFKEINDTLGHDIGDKLLTSVAKRLLDCVRSGDLVARLGGDEFAVVLDEISRPEDAGMIAQKILDSLALPHLLAGRELIVSSSIGIAVYTGEELTIDELNKHADIAMYGAKQAGRNTFHFFSPEVHASSLERCRLERDLRVAIGKNDFFVHYQPQVDVSSGKIIGVEALLRWRHEKLGLISPARFIPMAEEARIIDPLGEWILQTVCKEKDLLRTSAENQLLLAISVNVSALQLNHERFVETIKSILEKTGFPPHQLEIELTESALMKSPEISIPLLKEIREYGVKIAIDDFGTGYSSLSYLKNLPIDTLKIDISFVRDVGKDKNNDAIIKTIICMAQNLGLRVIAEGVETETQANFLRDNHCTLMQGFYFSPPLDHTEACKLIRDGLTVTPGSLAIS